MICSTRLKKMIGDSSGRVILLNCVGDFLQENRFAGAWRRRDESALSLTNRRDQIDDSHTQIAIARLQMQPTLGVTRPKIVERNACLCPFGLITIDRFDLEKRQIALPFLGRSHLSTYCVASPQIESLDLRRRDIDVVRPVEVVPVLAPKKAIALWQDFENAFARERLAAIEQSLLDAKDQVLFAEAGIVFRSERVGEFTELGGGLALQLGDVHGRCRRREHASHTVRMEWRRNRRGISREDRCEKDASAAPLRCTAPPSAAKGGGGAKVMRSYRRRKGGSRAPNRPIRNGRSAEVVDAYRP